MYLSTSTDMNVSKEKYCRRALDLELPPVLWIIHLDPNLHCAHVNFIEQTNIPGEQEFLFVPYSVFKVISVEWKDNPTWSKPHVVHLEAAIDNNNHPNDLDSCPWH